MIGAAEWPCVDRAGEFCDVPPHLNCVTINWTSARRGKPPDLREPAIAWASHSFGFVPVKTAALDVRSYPSLGTIAPRFINRDRPLLAIFFGLGFRRALRHAGAQIPARKLYANRFAYFHPSATRTTFPAAS